MELKMEKHPKKSLNCSAKSYVPSYDPFQFPEPSPFYPSIEKELFQYNYQSYWHPQICAYYLENRCKYGDKCLFYHPPKEEKVVKDQDCSICLDKIKAKNELFGFLPNCSHIFCLKCIRTWREKGKETNGKLCPICRTLSYYVISSRKLFETPEEKEKIHKEYLEKLLTIPCKMFQNGDGVCTFGKKCLYGHFDKNGIVVPKKDVKYKKKEIDLKSEIMSLSLFLRQITDDDDEVRNFLFGDDDSSEDEIGHFNFMDRNDASDSFSSDL